MQGMKSPSWEQLCFSVNGCCLSSAVTLDAYWCTLDRGITWFIPSFPEACVELLFLVFAHQPQELIPAVSCGRWMDTGHLRLMGIEPWKCISTVIRVMYLLANGHFSASLPRHNQKTLARNSITKLCQLRALYWPQRSEGSALVYAPASHSHFKCRVWGTQTWEI